MFRLLVIVSSATARKVQLPEKMVSKKATNFVIMGSGNNGFEPKSVGQYGPYI